MMKISKNLLIHSAFSFSVMEMNEDRIPVYNTPVELKNIWIDWNEVQTSATVGKQNADSGTFFFDCVNSEPKDFVPRIGMKILWNEKEMTINSVKPCYGLKGLEHYECGVV